MNYLIFVENRRGVPVERAGHKFFPGQKMEVSVNQTQLTEIRGCKSLVVSGLRTHFVKPVPMVRTPPVRKVVVPSIAPESVQPEPVIKEPESVPPMEEEQDRRTEDPDGEEGEQVTDRRSRDIRKPSGHGKSSSKKPGRG